LPAKTIENPYNIDTSRKISSFIECMKDHALICKFFGLSSSKTTLLEQKLTPTKCKVPRTKVLLLCNSGRLPTVTSVALLHTLGWLFSNRRDFPKDKIIKDMEQGL
jgi:hypothetical protein